jgi:hypothetical protein
MTDTLSDVADEVIDQQLVAERLLAQAREQGVDLVGPDGLLNQLTMRVLETALEEMSTISVMTSTTRSAATGGTPATGCGRRRC